MPRPKKRAKVKISLGKDGKRVSQQIIEGQTREIRKLEAELANTTGPVQKQLLAKQIGLERAELARFRKKMQ